MGENGASVARSYEVLTAVLGPVDRDAYRPLDGRVSDDGPLDRGVCRAVGYLWFLPSPGEPPPITFRTPLGLDLAVSLSRPVVAA
jgi:hypothetical protein